MSLAISSIACVAVVYKILENKLSSIDLLGSRLFKIELCIDCTIGSIEMTEPLVPMATKSLQSCISLNNRSYSGARSPKNTTFGLNLL